MATRFKLRSLVLLIAALALGVAVVMVSVENRRRRRELAKSQQRHELFVDDMVDLSGIELFVQPQPTPRAQAERMPDGVDAFAQPSKD
jgi:hypothetical protein